MKSTILKKIKPLHKKISSNNLKNNINNNSNKIENNDLNINYNSNNDIIINNDDNSSDTDNNYLTIEKDNNDNYNMNMEKIRALSNNMNNINKIIRNKKEYIFIKNNKEILENRNSLEKNKNKKIIKINNTNANKNLLEKEKRDNFINIQKLKIRNNKEFKKSNITSRKKLDKEKENYKKKVNKSLESEYNNKNNIKNNEESNSSLNDVKTIKDQDSIDLNSSFSNKKNEIDKKQKMEKQIIDLFLKNSNQVNLIKEYNQKNLKTKKSIKINNKKKTNINNNGNINIMDEEEKTIIYSKEKNDIKDINIMNYYKILINRKNKNKNIKENLSNNIVNSEKKIVNPHFEFFHSNSNDLVKKLEFKIKNGKRIKENDKKYILNEQRKQNILGGKKNIKNNLIKENIISNKNLNLFCNEEDKNKNIPNINNNNITKINKKNIIKYVDNSINLIPNYKNKKKEIKKSSDFSLKIKELSHLNYKKLTQAKKKNILLINEGNNSINDEKLKTNTNNNFNNFKKSMKIKSIEKNIKTDLSNRNNKDNNDNNILNNNNINNFDNYQFEAKKNKTYFVSNNEQKIINISSKDIHKIEEKKQIIKCNNKNKVNKNNIKQINKSNKSNKEKKENRENNNNNIKRNNYIDLHHVPPSENNINIDYSNLIKNYKTNEYNLKRSISPHLNNCSLYSNFQSNKLVLMNKSQNQNQNKFESKKKDFKININNEIHTEFFKNEDNKNINTRYSHNVNNNTETYFYLDETIEDLSRSLKKNSDCLVNNNNCFTYTKGNRHISPINNHKQKRIYSSNSSKTNKMINNNANNVTSTGKFKRSSIVLKNKNAFNKSKIKINVENILNTDFKYSLSLMPNKEKEKRNNESQTLSNKKNANKIYKNKKTKNSSFIDIQIPLVPEENNQVISLKTMKYNLCINSNENTILKMKKIFRNAEIMKIILVFLTNDDLFNLSLVNNLCLKITKKKILENIMNNIINNNNNEKLINKIWNIELIKYSNFSNMENFDIIYNNFLNTSKKYDKEIIKDLLRTFPNDNSFHKGAESYNKLFNVLKAYSNYNSEIGYAQGMNFIVGKLIKFFKCEKKTFIYLDSLFNKLKMENVMGIYNCLENKMKIVQYLLNKLCPNIVKFLEIKKINHGIFTASWFITLFSKSFKYDNILLILWNFSIIFGWKFIFLFSISVVIAFKDKYSELDLYDFTQYMKNIFNLDYFKKKFLEIMKLTFYYMSEWKNIIKDIDVDYLDEAENTKIKTLLINRKKRKENILNQSHKESLYKEVEDKETDIL